MKSYVSSQAMVPALNVQNVSKFYGQEKAVKDVSFSIKQGEFFGLLGPNGAGKSTTINMAAGVATISKGKIQIFGHDVKKEFLTSRHMTGLMHQEVVMDVFLNMEEAISLIPGYYGVRKDKAWINSLIDRLALRPYLKKTTNKLSGGTKRRFMIAKALIHKPKLLILDEPTAGVDVDLRHSLWDFLRYINKQGTTVLLTTHYLEEAENMCQRIAIMNKGKVIALEKKEKLLDIIGKKKMTVSLIKETQIIPEVLLEEKPKLNNNGKEFIFEISHGQSTEKIIKKMLDAGINFTDIKTEKVNLEEVFLKLTKVNS